jgi:hypothetical protein
MVGDSTMTAEPVTSGPCRFAVAMIRDDDTDADLVFLSTCICGWTERHDDEAVAWRAGYGHLGQLDAVLTQYLRRSPRLDDHGPPPKKRPGGLIEEPGPVHGVLLTLFAACGGPGPASSHFMGQSWTAPSHHCRGVVPGRSTGHTDLELCVCACHADAIVAARMQAPYDAWITRMQARRDRWRHAEDEWRNRPWPVCAGCAADSGHRPGLGRVADNGPHDPRCQCPCTWGWQCERGQHDRCHGPSGTTDPIWGAPCGCACHAGVALPVELRAASPAPTSTTPPTVSLQASLFS